MIIDCISDLHGHKPELPGGDLLLLCGDYTASEKLTDWPDFFIWLQAQKYRKKILIAGNHDNFLDEFTKHEDFEYLFDSGTEFEGLKIWGSPWSLWFKRLNPFCQAFVGDEIYLRRRFELIPQDTNILMTHTPPQGILDKNCAGNPCGSQSLGTRISRLPELTNCVFGHIHEAFGQETFQGVQYNNCSMVNEKYQLVNPPTRL